MKKGKVVLGIFLIALSVEAVVIAYFFWRDNDTSKRNSLITKAKDEYESREYVSAYKTYQELIDSLGFDNEAASFNYANATLLSSDFLLRNFNKNKLNHIPEGDSVQQHLMNSSRQLFTLLTVAADEDISSKAYNQIGVSIMKAAEKGSKDEWNTVLGEGLMFFKEALKKDPTNDNARYNYELIKKIYGFPETVLAETKALIAQQRYREAYALLESGMKRDIRLRSNKDFLQRIKSVIAIDSAYKTRNL
jgi:tetratricopeptide (TPR) repeat protein